MAIIVACACGTKLSAREDLRGKRIKCPECGGAVLVKDAMEGAAEKAAKPAPKKLRCPSCRSILGAGSTKCMNCGTELPERESDDDSPGRKTKKRKKSRGSVLPTIFLGGVDLPFVVWFPSLLVLLAAGGGIAYLAMTMEKGSSGGAPGIRVVGVKPVVAAKLFPNDYGPTFAIYREQGEGDHLLVNVRLPKELIDEIVHQSEFSLTNRDFRLLHGSEGTDAICLVNRVLGPKEARVVKNERVLAVFTRDLQSTAIASEVVTMTGDPPAEENLQESKGTRTISFYPEKNAVTWTSDYSGATVRTLTSDSNNESWIQGSIQATCLFVRPKNVAGELKLSVLGGEPIVLDTSKFK